ncbi:MAG: DUF6088 family protein [Paludibacter sp.]|nr:DUF6088 family protein [Paludibacter sp.]
MLQKVVYEKKMESIDKQIEKKIKQNRRGKIFFGEDFAKFGMPDAIRVTLHRMAKKKDCGKELNGRKTGALPSDYRKRADSTSDNEIGNWTLYKILTVRKDIK